MAMTDVTLAALAVLCMVGHATGISGSTCGVDSRPHAEGICGNTLVRARETLCFILYTDYPDHFGRSMNKRSVIDIFDYPVHVFANMNLARQVEKMSQPKELQGSSGSMGKLLEYLYPRMKVAQSGARASSKMSDARPGSMFSKRDGGELQSVQKRGMVCDCCFNKCRTSELARYC